MGVFDEREKAHENKYFRDQDLRFKAIARRNKLFGQWVAGKLGLSAQEADAYALDVVKADFKEPGDGDVLAKVGGDLKTRGKAVPEAELRKELDRCLKEAIRQLEAEK
jgi:hypothetical protein